MPNHETNSVIIKGPVSVVHRFVEEGTRSNGMNVPIRMIDFELIVPPPANMEAGGCPGGAVDGIHSDTGEVCWYDWNLANWGTKWNAYEHDHFDHRVFVGGDDGLPYARVELRFQTAWSPPTPIFDAIKSRWQGLEVIAVTQDEGGFPDRFYPSEEYLQEHFTRTVTYEFDCWDSEVDTPLENPADVTISKITKALGRHS